jgi:hypothetical protein
MFVSDPVGGFPPGTPGGASLDHAGSGTTAPTMVGSFVMFASAFGDESRLSGKAGTFQRLSIACECGWHTALSLRALSSPAH